MGTAARRPCRVQPRLRRYAGGAVVGARVRLQPRLQRTILRFAAEYALIGGAAV